MAKAIKRSNLPSDPLPVHRGPFLFGPQYLPPEDWFASFEILITEALQDSGAKASIVQAYDGRHARVIFDKAELTIDAEGGVFSLDENGSWQKDDEIDAWIGPFGPPRQFLQRLSDQKHVAYLGLEHPAIMSFTSALFRRMRARFFRAIEMQLVHVVGRVGSPLEAETIFTSGQLKYLTIDRKDRDRYLVEDYEPDEAICNDERVYLVGIRPASKVSATSTKRIKRTRGAPRTVDEGALRQIMLRLMRLRGIPKRGQTGWNQEACVKAVRRAAENDGIAAGRTTVIKNLPPVIEMLRKSLSHKDFHEFANSKISPN